MLIVGCANHFHLSACNEADFSRAFHVAESVKVARRGLTSPFAELAGVCGGMIKTERLAAA